MILLRYHYRDIITLSLRINPCRNLAKKKGDLNLDNLYDIHIRFLRNCRTQLFLDPGAVLIMKSIKRILAMIQQFCSIFEDFVVTQVKFLNSFGSD